MILFAPGGHVTATRYDMLHSAPGMPRHALNHFDDVLLEAWERMSAALQDCAK